MVELREYRVSMGTIIVEATDENDALQQARSMIENGAWDLRLECYCKQCDGPVADGECQECHYRETGEEPS